MSAPDESAPAELKAGHAPAVKVGGMRVVQHKKEAEKAEAPAMTAEEEQEFGSGDPKADTHHQSMVVSGAPTKGDKDFTTQAVKSFHVKPMPKHDSTPKVQQQNMHINQPR